MANRSFAREYARNRPSKASLCPHKTGVNERHKSPASPSRKSLLNQPVPDPLTSSRAPPPFGVSLRLRRKRGAVEPGGHLPGLAVLPGGHCLGR